MKNTHKVFVYGTLMSEFHNHYLLNDSKYLGNGKTNTKMIMVQSSPTQGIPFVVDNDLSPFIQDNIDFLNNISGEVYECNDDTLKHLDRLEGHPNWYIRKEVMIKSEFGGYHRAWIYTMPIEGLSHGKYYFNILGDFQLGQTVDETRYA
jgi:gamma-glutamylaminecyclotransferase